jgi:hypothetical protein
MFRGKQREIVMKLPARHPFRRSWEEKYGPIDAQRVISNLLVGPCWGGGFLFADVVSLH